MRIPLIIQSSGTNIIGPKVRLNAGLYRFIQEGECDGEVFYDFTDGSVKPTSALDIKLVEKPSFVQVKITRKNKTPISMYAEPQVSI